MAQYEHLPVFKKSYDLLLTIYQSVGMFGKEFKYTIGEKLKNEALELIVCIYKANSRVNKLSMITEAKEHLEVARLYNPMPESHRSRPGRVCHINPIVLPA
jgi:hypothetical protein